MGEAAIPQVNRVLGPRVNARKRGRRIAKFGADELATPAEKGT